MLFGGGDGVSSVQQAMARLYKMKLNKVTTDLMEETMRRSTGTEGLRWSVVTAQLVAYEVTWGNCDAPMTLSWFRQWMAPALHRLLVLEGNFWY
jgi:hypothetical protein